MMKKLIPTLLLFVFFSTECTYNNVYINREDDNIEGKTYLKKIYQDIEAKNFDHLDAMVSDSLKQLAGPNGVSKLVVYINRKVGNYKSYIVVDRYIRAVTGSNNEISYNYKLKVTYDKGIIDEVIGFKKQNGSAIKIYTYHANSDLLMR